MDPFREIERMFGMFENGPRGFPGMITMSSSTSSTGGLHPSMDLQETQKAYKLTAEVPGIPQKDIEIKVSDNRVCVSGRRTIDFSPSNKVNISPKDEDASAFLCWERRPGEFQRCFTLPNKVNEGKVAATLKDGILEVTLEKMTPSSVMRSVPFN